MEHKVQSTVLQSDLAKLADKRQILCGEARASVVAEIAQLEGK